MNRGTTSALGGITFHHPGAFWFGALAVTVGVVLHLPMYLMGRDTGYRLAGMPMDSPMLLGMGAIVIGLIASLYGLLPRHGAVPMALAVIAMACFGVETCKRRLEEIAAGGAGAVQPAKDSAA